MLYIACDHAGFELKDNILALFKKHQIEAVDLSQIYIEGDDYPVVAQKLAKHVAEKDDAMGIAVCGTGQGICMALNRYKGIRSGITDDERVVQKLREHNDANILCLSSGTSPSEALKLVQIFLKTRVSSAPRHARRRAMLDLDKSDITAD